MVEFSFMRPPISFYITLEALGSNGNAFLHAFYQANVTGTIQVLRNAIGVGRSIRINANERYGGVGGLRFNVIGVTRRREVSFFQKN